jgi:hypothetical protein
MGKTTLCKALCNELSCEYEGRTCYVELTYRDSSLKDLLQKILIKLTRYNAEGLQELDDGDVNSYT